MGEYTVSLRYLIERGYPLALDRYPIFDEIYRDYLNKKDHRSLLFQGDWSRNT